MSLVNSDLSASLLTDGAVILPEPCPAPAAFQAESCQDSITVDIPAVHLSGMGRVIQVNASILGVCPGKRVAVAVILVELDADGTERPCGLKTITIPPQSGTECRDITLKCVSFVVPDHADSDGHASSLCASRNFRARVLANYLDTDFVCCESQTDIV